MIFRNISGKLFSFTDHLTVSYLRNRWTKMFFEMMISIPFFKKAHHHSFFNEPGVSLCLHKLLVQTTSTCLKLHMLLKSFLPLYFCPIFSARTEVSLLFIHCSPPCSSLACLPHFWTAALTFLPGFGTITVTVH